MKQTKYYIEVNTKAKQTGNKDNPSFAIPLDKKKLRNLGIDPTKKLDVVVLQND